jgi:hypothetical protein
LEWFSDIFFPFLPPLRCVLNDQVVKGSKPSWDLVSGVGGVTGELRRRLRRRRTDVASDNGAARQGVGIAAKVFGVAGVAMTVANSGIVAENVLCRVTLKITTAIFRVFRNLVKFSIFL